jgi:ferritin heavy chain
MLRVSPSPAAASANLPAAAGSVARAFVTVATPRPFRTTCRAAAKGKELLSGVVFQLFEELRVSCPLCHRSLPVAHAAQVHRRV